VLKEEFTSVFQATRYFPQPVAGLLAEAEKLFD
jgi:hypothetical protein